jgi:hypothetical protein
MAPWRAQAAAMPASPDGWARRAIAAGEMKTGWRRRWLRKVVERSQVVQSMKMRGRRRMER